MDTDVGAVLPLTQEQLEDACAQVKELKGETNGILRPTAQRHIQGYLTNYISLFAEPERPVYIDGTPPIWRAKIFLRLRGQGRVCELGTIDVNASNGRIMPIGMR